MSNFLNRTSRNSSAAFTFFQNGIVKASQLPTNLFLLMLMSAVTKQSEKSTTEESRTVSSYC